MSWLNKFGLGRKRVTNGNSLQDNDLSRFRASITIKIAMLGAFLLLVIALFPRYNTANYSYIIGDVWRNTDVVATYTFALLKTSDELAKEQAEIKLLNPPIFHVNDQARISAFTHLDSLFRIVEIKQNEYLQWKLSAAASRQADSIRFYDTINATLPLGMNRTGWRPLLLAALDVKKNGPSPSFVNGTLAVREAIETVTAELFETGVINLQKSQLPGDEITLRDVQRRTEKSLFKATVKDPDEAAQFAAFRLPRMLPQDMADPALALFSQTIHPNYQFNARETKEREEDALSTLSPTKGAVPMGTVIIRKGEVITDEKRQMLMSFDKANAGKATEIERWQAFAGDFIVLAAVLLVFFMYLFLYRRPIFDDNIHLLLVLLCLLIVCVASAFASRLEFLSEWAVPVTIAPVVLTIIFDSRVGIFSSITLAMVVALMQSNDFEFVVATVCVSSMAVYSVRDIRNRSQFFFVTPGLILATYAVVMVGFTLSRGSSFEVLADKLLMVLLNAALIFFAFPIILLFEKMFGVTTDVSLLELSDTNRPLLKALMMHAPGTFHHSLQVANLSEAAADSIGANAMLCRVGAYYHDIGKMDKASFFVENQKGVNPHENTSPLESARIIREHVPNGVKLAEEERLPRAIIDFIRSHHGTSSIRFFLEKARELQPDINEADFRYPGPLPVTKETAIVLLADGIEAIARSMSDPSNAKLEAMINRYVDEKISEGQLSYSPLTFEDIFRIKQSFLTILAGMYHARVKYPGQEKLENAQSEHVSDSV